MTPQAIVTLAADTASADATFFFRVRGERMSLEIATREPTESTLHELAALVLDRVLWQLCGWRVDPRPPARRHRLRRSPLSPAVCCTLSGACCTLGGSSGGGSVVHWVAFVIMTRRVLGLVCMMARLVQRNVRSSPGAQTHRVFG